MNSASTSAIQFEVRERDGSLQDYGGLSSYTNRSLHPAFYAVRIYINMARAGTSGWTVTVVLNNDMLDRKMAIVPVPEK